MKSKRLLTLLLSLCLVLSLVTPAFAVKVGVDSFAKPSTSSEQVIRPGTSASGNGLLASGQGTGSLNLRDHPITVSEVHKSFFEGIWEVTPGNAPELNLLQAKAPACLEDLVAAEADYAPDEMVRAFIVLEDAPLAEKYSSISSVSASAQKNLTDKQDTLIANIEKYVLNGGKLDVRYQLTYLTNSITVETEFSNLAEIACFNGVKSVFITPTYSVCETVSNPNTAASGAMTGVPSIWGDLGFTGQGMKIAIIDSGLDLDHPSFAALDSELVAEYDSYMDMDDIAAVLLDLNAYSRRTTITAKTLYRSTKVPYAFNYCDDTLLADHSGDNQGDHGTHVSGIAAANKIEGIPVVGMAPDAQIIVMKVFGVNGGAYADDIAAALEDAMTLGCDVVNASLGSPSGFTDSGIAEIDAIYDRLANQNIIATISAGNEGTSASDNMWGTDLNRTQNPENGTVGSPALYHNGFIIASAENSEVMTDYFTLGDGTRIFYNGSLEYIYGYVYGMEILADEPYEYVFIDGMGADIEEFYDDEGNSLVEGKIAVVWRGGGVTFGTKISNAEYAGAVACVIANNNDTDDIFNFYMSTELEEDVYPGIPTCLVSQADALVMQAAEDKTMTTSATPAARVCEGGQMSSFSSWGVSSDLRLVPDITGIGGNVFSCYDDGQYGVMSGTSMSSPQLAGISALVMQYLYNKYPDAANDGTIREMALALLMSTADPIISSDTNLAVSPRQQGAGLVNAAEAVKTAAYLTVNGSRPKVEMGDSATGSYTFTFEIHNFGDADQTYVLSSSLLTEAVVEQYGEYFMAGYETELSGSVSFDKESVTVAAGETATVTVSISLSDRDKAMFTRYWENGGYVEGYVYLENTADEGIDLNLPFMGFYGDWTKAPVFDSAYWYDNSFWDVGDGWPDGDEFYHVLRTSLDGTNWVLGFNPYSGAYTDAAGNVVYDPANNSISPNGDGVVDGLSNIYISLLRNAKTMTITFTNADTGEVLHTETSINNNKTMYISAYGQIVPWLYSWYGEGMYNFAGLANNTKVLMTVEATVDYGDGGKHMIQIPMTIDTEVPELKDVYQYEENGSHYLTVVASDNVNVGGIFLMNRAGTQIYGADYCLEANSDGEYVATFKVDELGTELMIVLGDYAGNEGYYNITYTEAGENLPDMPTDLLYAYRIMDSAIYSDHMFGWISMEFPAEGDYAEIAVWSDDFMEYAALTAAEYAGGKIFAVDAVYNLVVMDPGLWNRTTICNLGVSVLDMTFDDSTDTMYVLVKDGYYVSLQKLDLMTGELTMVKSYGYYYFNVPWAITDDDNGTLYAIKYNNSGLYILDSENNYAPTAVVDGDGNAVTITDSNGSAVSPSYSQSIAYVDGTIYWAYIGWSGSELIAIDLDSLAVSNYAYSAWAEDTDGNVINYYPNTELVGLLTLKETEWTIPEGSVLEGLMLDADSLVLTPGQSEILHVSPTPWNYVLENVEWTSDDEAVATVENGVVTAVSEGFATITASVGDVEVSCAVIVVDTDTTFHAYNFYSGDGYDGYMIEVDTGLMNYYLEAESPVDFLSGDYNGHDGCFYGYSEGGQFWRYDMKTAVAVKLGDPIGSVPADMAYDYSTGLMYAIVVDTNSGISSLCQVNLNNGQLQTVYQGYFYLMTLAADMDGNLYSISSDGYLFWMGEVYDDWFEEYVWSCQVLMEGLGELQYMQSMCYDYANDVLLWAYCEASSVYWIDFNNGYVISLGDPTDSGIFEFVGMYTVPEEIPDLDPVPVRDYYAEDMVMLTGSTKFPNATVLPFNATCQNIVWTSEDESIVRVNADGSLSAVAAGTVTISGELYDEVMDETYELSFTVTVIEGADDIYGMLMTDLANYNGQCWLRLYATDPSVTDILGYTDYEIFAEEYYDGKVYAYGYDPMDWSGAWYYFILDANTHAILEMHDMGAAFPFVYDMTYDYTTSTMYAVAGPNDASDFYAVNMKTGELVLLIQTEQFFMSLTASPDGTLYAIEKSLEEGDWWSGYTLTNAQMYTINPTTCEVEWYSDTGILCNMLASMAYDYDTDYIYWTPLAQSTSNISGLCLIDPATGEAFNLGTIGSAGCQVSGLYIISENFPEEPELSLMNVVMDPTKTVVTVGSTVQLNAYALPLALDVDIVWTSSDETVATVDENGVVTGLSQGAVEIIATVTYDGVTKSAACKVGVLESDASFLSWNRTDMGWSAISRADYTVVTNLTEGEEVGVSAIASVGKDVYGYDVNNRLFRLNLSDFTRTAIGEDVAASAIDMYLSDNDPYGFYVPEQFRFEVRDVAYDAANDRLLVLGTVQMYNDFFGEYDEILSGSSIYEVDLETGELTVLYTFDDVDFVYGMTVDNDGMVYFYMTFNDTVYKLDLESGVYSQVISLQSQSLYGEYGDGIRQALYYDELTGLIYMTFTSNNRLYRMLSIDPATGALSILSDIGLKEYDPLSWSYIGDCFSGLTFAKHEHSYTAVVTPPTCTEQGYTTYTCACGDSYVDDYTDPTGHHYGDDGVCEHCGEKDPDFKPEVNPGTADTFNGTLWMTLAVITGLGAVLVIASKKSWLSK